MAHSAHLSQGGRGDLKLYHERVIPMYRVPVISKDGKPLMPTKSSRARRWLNEGKAVVYKNDLHSFAVQLTIDSGKETQPIAVGIDPGKHYSGIGVQSSKATLFTAHLELPFQRVKNRMETRAMMRRSRSWETAKRRDTLGLEKDRNKSSQTPATHAVDGVALASYQFLKYKYLKGDKGWFEGSVEITNAPFSVIKRPPISRRQLHLMLPAKDAVRRKYGGTVTRHNVRKGDYVETERKGVKFRGWVSGDTKTQVSVSDFDWKRLGQFSAKNTQVLKRSTNLIVNTLNGGRAFLSH